MAKATKKTAKVGSKAKAPAKASKAKAAAKAPVKAVAKATAPKAKPSSKTSSARSTSSAGKKPIVKPSASKSAKPSVAKSTGANKTNKQNESKSTTVKAQAANGKANSNVGAGKRITGVVTSVAAGVAAGVAASVVSRGKGASSKLESKRSMPKEQPEENFEPGGITRPATKTAPAMRLSVNDAEILATAKERYGKKDLEIFRKLILDQRAEASEEFDIISEQMLDTSGEFDADNQSFSLHTAEQGTDAMEREKTFLHAQRTSDYIKKLDEAIARIDRGTYGICVICGRLIEKQRLAAVPITQKHVDCKNKTQAKKLSVDQTYRSDMDEPIIE